MTSINHLSRRALMKGALATAAGGVVMNWGGLTGFKAIAAEARKVKKHCILLWMNGGASQFETFDMKPGRPTGGPFRPIDTNVPGVRVCELMPKMAKQMDKVAVIRSMRTSEVDHPGGIYLMHTGYKASSNGDAGAGFLGPKYQPFGVGSDGNLPQFSSSTMDAAKEAKRHDLRSFVDQQFTKETNSEVAKMHVEGYEAARRLQKGREAFKIDAEWAKSKDLYGDSEF